MRAALAAAKEENELDREIAKLKGQVRDLRERGATKSSDPQADLLAGVTGGWLSPRDVSRALALLLAMTIEFVSAFGPIVITSYVEAMERCDAARRDDAPAEGLIEKPVEAPGLVTDYLAARIEPAADAETVTKRGLYADYAAWCRAHERTALSAAEFVGEVDKARAENDLGNVIRKRKGGYGGIRLAAAS